MVNGKIRLSSPTMHGEEMQYIQEAFDKNWVAPLGFNCDGFEAEMVEYLKTTGAGCKHDLHTLCLVSGTSALHLAVKLAGVKPGDTVLCSDMTFAATVNPVSYEGGRQVFIDSERETWNMDPEALEEGFRQHPEAKVVMLAHLYGTPSKMDEIKAVCKEHGAILIEDAAEALSATYKGRPCGTFGNLAAFSFNGNKIITTSSGGMLITRNEQQREKALFWATQSREDALWYQHKEIGYNYRMSNIVAGIGRGQLKHLDEHRAIKEKIYRRYQEGFKGLPVSMNPYLPDTMPNFWLSCLLIDPDAMCKATIAVSAQLAQVLELLKQPDAPSIDCLRAVVSSSALLEESIKRELIEKLQCEFHEMYGTSETSTITNICFQKAPDKQKSVGLPFYEAKIRILRDDNNTDYDTDCAVGEIGEIACKTSLLCKGYYKQEAMLNAAMLEGYFRTGDLGYLDEDGYLYFSGRKKEIIITGAVNVYPHDIDMVVEKMPEVEECAAFAYPDDRLIEVVALAVVPREDSELSPRMIKTYCARNLADFQQPHKVFIVDHLPKNTMGKLQRMSILEYVREMGLDNK